MKKNSLLTFIFALMPGAGQMYLGLMKKGVSIMSLFFGVILVAILFNMEYLTIALPIIWFYSFFDAINFNSMPYEKKELIEDKFLFFDCNNKFLTGGVLLFIGVYAIFTNIARPFLWYIQDNFPFGYDIVRNIPTLVISVFIVLIGFKLIKGNKKEVEDLRDKEFKEYGKDDNMNQ